MDFKEYWENYYAKHKVPQGNSQFAEFVLNNYLKQDGRKICDLRLLELGGGNGRDSIFFARHKIIVTAIDQAKSEIEYLQHYVRKHLNTNNPNIELNPNFIAGDFTQLESFDFPPHFDCIYSRFTLHSIDKASQNNVLLQSFRLLKNGGILAIEARGKKNSLYQKGQEVQKDAFIYEQHYRRFLDFDNSIDEIKNICGSGSFDILFSAEERGFAPYKNEDDYFIRIIAKKS